MTVHWLEFLMGNFLKNEQLLFTEMSNNIFKSKGFNPRLLSRLTPPNMQGTFG